MENKDENSPQTVNENKGNKKIDEIIEKLDHKFPLLEKVDERDDDLKETETQTKVETRTESARRSRMSFDLKNTPEKSGREKVVKRSESARAFRRIPSSLSLIFGMKKELTVSGRSQWLQETMTKTNISSRTTSSSHLSKQ